MGYPPTPRVILTVSALTAVLRSHVESAFADIWVEGEVSNLRMPSSGHAYFTLKDATSQMRAVMFRSVGRFLRFHLKDGMCVICRGRLTVYEPKGDYQMLVDYVEPKGVGALQVAFEQLKERLAAEGLFEAARKRPLPVFPRRLGIITSPTGAAIRDIIQVAHRRWPNIELLLNPVGVQGIGAAAEIAKAIAELNELGGLDVLVVGRGGGSLEDLWAFNEEIVARAIVASRIPVVSAVGHEIDFTIADFVADERAPTPTAAAEMVVPRKADLRQQIAMLNLQLSRNIQFKLETAEENLRGLVKRLADPGRKLRENQQRLDELSVDLLRRFQERLRQGKNRLAEAAGRMSALSPLAVLERGYCIAHKLPEERIVKSAATLAVGDLIRVTFAAGKSRC